MISLGYRLSLGCRKRFSSLRISLCSTARNKAVTEILYFPTRDKPVWSLTFSRKNVKFTTCGPYIATFIQVILSGNRKVKYSLMLVTRTVNLKMVEINSTEY